MHGRTARDSPAIAVLQETCLCMHGCIARDSALPCGLADMLVGIADMKDFGAGTQRRPGQGGGQEDV